MYTTIYIYTQAFRLFGNYNRVAGVLINYDDEERYIITIITVMYALVR